MSAALVGIGAGIFMFLGIAHAVFTFQSSPSGGPMMPTDPDVRAGMSTTGGLGLAPHIDSNLYKAWIGFNLSHSLGVVVAAGVLIRHAIVDFSQSAGQAWFIVLAVAVPAIYFVLAQLYWFDKPRNGIAVGATLVWVGLILEML